MVIIMIDRCIYITTMQFICNLIQLRQIVNNKYYQATSMILDYFNRFYDHDLMCIDFES